MAVAVPGRMLVHGGFDGTHHLDDIWSLDLVSWQWTRVACKVGDGSPLTLKRGPCIPFLFHSRSQGEAPSAGRGQAADVVAGRHLVLHGGYDGGIQPLSDAHVLDLETGAWSRLDIGTLGGSGDAPAPRSLHTLTAVGHACVLLGGSGALGALGDVHLLESPSVTLGMALQRRMVEARAALSEEQMRSAGLQGDLRRVALERDWHVNQQRVRGSAIADRARQGRKSLSQSFPLLRRSQRSGSRISRRGTTPWCGPSQSWRTRWPPRTLRSRRRWRRGATRSSAAQACSAAWSARGRAASRRPKRLRPCTGSSCAHVSRLRLPLPFAWAALTFAKCENDPRV